VLVSSLAYLASLSVTKKKFNIDDTRAVPARLNIKSVAQDFIVLPRVQQSETIKR
jgi:hypothetical protein